MSLPSLKIRKKLNKLKINPLFLNHQRIEVTGQTSVVNTGGDRKRNAKSYSLPEAEPTTGTR